MFIKKCLFQEVQDVPGSGSGRWFWLKGRIGIEGEFTEKEWQHIKDVFLAIGLYQMDNVGERLSDKYPTRYQVTDAIMTDARNCNTAAMDKLRLDYPAMKELSLIFR